MRDRSKDWRPVGLRTVFRLVARGAQWCYDPKGRPAQIRSRSGQVYQYRSASGGMALRKVEVFE